MKINVLYESDWGIGGHSNPDEDLYLDHFIGCDDGIITAAEEVYALHKQLGFVGDYDKREVGLRYGAALLTAINRQVHRVRFPSQDDTVQAGITPDWLQETVYEFRDRATGDLICYQHVVWGDCGTTYFTVEEE